MTLLPITLFSSKSAVAECSTPLSSIALEWQALPHHFTDHSIGEWRAETPSALCRESEWTTSCFKDATFL